MLNVAIHGLGNWGSKLVDSVRGSATIKFVQGITRSPDGHREFAANFKACASRFVPLPLSPSPRCGEGERMSR